MIQIQYNCELYVNIILEDEQNIFECFTGNNNKKKSK